MLLATKTTEDVRRTLLDLLDCPQPRTVVVVDILEAFRWGDGEGLSSEIVEVISMPAVSVNLSEALELAAGRAEALIVLGPMNNDSKIPDDVSVYNIVQSRYAPVSV